MTSSDEPAIAGRPVFLSPHYDDATLSCGGTIALLAAGGAAPLVITVFGGGPDAHGLTDFARWQHERWGTGLGDTQSVRRAEDRHAAGILGYETRWLEYRDAIYRGDRYLTDEALFGPVAPDEARLVDQLAGRIAALSELGGGGSLYVPLAVGNHVDHQIIFQAGCLLAAAGTDVLAYEDFPYTALDGELDRRLVTASAELGAPRVVDISATLARRIAAIAAYPSQLDVIFRFWPSMPAAVEAYAFGIGGNVPAERYWPVRPERL